MPKRVLIVDDSPTIRGLIRAVLAPDPRLEVVGEATNPYEARELIKALHPDVLTLDVEMPRMNGLAFLEKLMRLRPMPVVMISSQTQNGSRAALEALALGAVECIGKPVSGGFTAAFGSLADLLVAAAGARLRLPGRRLRVAPATGFDWNGRIVLIGSSTGGVDALETLLAGFPENCPPTLITQHMPEGFLVSFAKRLAGRIAPRMVLAREGEPLVQGMVAMAPGGETHLELAPGLAPRCRLRRGEKVGGYRPSVDVLFRSAEPVAERTVAVLLTGMGRDGAAGMLALRQGGARCLAQDEETSVVFGMPRAALEIGAAERPVALPEMSAAILDLCRAAARPV
ncbi:chemotaxis-specific protein-glutamate methyltransferase CheB [Sinirhodobacter hankyongi]|uniref:Protein-glutamate methylesterase/protein-glutamine glutaminase n=1 Tax=Paenirhodobacter hankyongi TaxID=2294033 RepID=A0A421BK47_9RHOB|nr:chemotaxis-specific protein-glutamate methyltransferase CheB [Sinirhodobacter hankyongi]